MMAGRGRRRLLVALTAAITLTLTLGPAELVLRWRERRLAEAARPRERLDLLQPNPHGTGSYRLKPNLRLTTTVQGRTVEIRTNSHGMRWREIPLAKPAGVRRVAFLGDSYAFGCWSSSIERSFVGVFDAHLAGRGVETLNFGVGGYGPDEEALILEEEVLRFSPDYVIVALFDGNDLRDTHLGLRKHRLEQGSAELDEQVVRARVPAEFLVNDRVESQPLPDPSWLRSSLRGLASYRFLEPLLGWRDRRVQFAASRRFLAYSFWSRIPYPAVALQARDATLAALARIHDRCAERGIRLGILAIPTHDQVHAARESGRDYDIAFPQAYVQVFAREQGIAYLDLLPPLRACAHERNSALYLPVDQHLDDEGHALAGERIVEWFRSELR